MKKLRIALYAGNMNWGLASIISALEKNGHTCDVFVHKYETDIIKQIVSFLPDIVGFSMFTGEHHSTISLMRELRPHLNSIFVVGGIHSITYPSIIEDEDVIDAVCTGEGEHPMIQLAHKIACKEDYLDLEGFWFRKKNEILKNPLSPLTPQLDTFGNPNIDIFYDKYDKLKNDPYKTFILSRGCPYRCSFCYAHIMKAKFNEKSKKFVRFHDVECTINHIKNTKNKYPLEAIRFADSTFSFNLAHLNKFLPRLKKEIDLPYLINARFDNLNEKLVKLLKETGCDRVTLGVECGNEDYRKNILVKNITNEQVIKGAELLHKYKLRFDTQSMVGLPGETVNNAFETARLNAKINPSVTRCHIFMPYPGTELGAYAKEKGYLDKNFHYTEIGDAHAQRSSEKNKAATSFHTDLFAYKSVLKQKNISELCNFKMFFHLLVKYPYLEPIVRILIKLPKNSLFPFIHNLPRLKQGIKYKEAPLPVLIRDYAKMSILWSRNKE